MLPISVRAIPCTRVAQTFARLNLGASRGYAVGTTATKKEKKVKKASARPKLDKSQLPPKRPISGFAKYILENKHLITNDNRSPFTALSVKWSEMSISEKQTYSRSQQDWDRYNEAFGQWKENVDPAVLEQVNKLRKAKGLPPIKTTKRFASSYALFIKEQFVSHKLETGEHGGIISTSKAAAEKWKGLSDEEKQIWKDKAAAAKEEWLKTHGKDDQV